MNLRGTVYSRIKKLAVKRLKYKDSCDPEEGRIGRIRGLGTNAGPRGSRAAPRRARRPAEAGHPRPTGTRRTSRLRGAR